MKNLSLSTALILSLSFFTNQFQAQSTLNNQSCGKTNVTLVEDIIAEHIVNVEMYKFLVTKLPNFSEIISSPDKKFKLSELNGQLQPNATYEIKVKTVTGGQESVYGAPCLITTGPINSGITTTKLSNQSCDITGVDLNQELIAKGVPGASQYEFLVENTALGYSESVVSTDRKFFLSELSIQPQLSETYDIKVRAKLNGSFGVYSQSCFVTTIGSSTLDLGGAKSYSILTGGSVTANNPINVFGDVGAFGGVSGTINPGVHSNLYSGNTGNVQSAKNDLQQLIVGFNTMNVTNTLTSIDGMTLAAGVYEFNNGLTISGHVTLSGDKNSQYVFIVKNGNLLTTNTSFIDFGKVSPENIIWYVKKNNATVTLSSGSFMSGVIITSGADIDYQADNTGYLAMLSVNGDITLNDNGVKRYTNIKSYDLLKVLRDEKSCGSNKIRQDQLNANPAIQQHITDQEEFIKLIKTGQVPSTKAIDPLVDNIIIPVVVHVIHDQNDAIIGQGTNISLAQIQSQMDALNNAYNPHGISFCLATVPTGVFSWNNGENGVMRYSEPSTSNVLHTAVDAGFADDLLGRTHSNGNEFPFDKYLNIWVVGSIASTASSWQVPPPANSPGVQGYSPQPLQSNLNIWNLDGVVVRYDVFGDNSTGGTFPLQPNSTTTSTSWQRDEGKVMVHEVGHYLNLIHAFHSFSGNCEGTNPAGSGPDECDSNGDNVCDTPPSLANSTHICGLPAPTTCTPWNGFLDDMTENYMYYAFDPCQNMFSLGQIDRVGASLQAIPDRLSLVSYPNIAYTNPIGCGTLIQMADFFYDGGQCVGDVVTFTTYTGNAFDVVTSWDWDIDGTTISTTNSTLSYTFTTGNTTYPVTLTANFANGGSTSWTDQIYISDCNVQPGPNSNWYFGNYANIGFSGGFPPVAGTNSQMFALEACVSVSNDNGDVLFYSNSENVWDQNGSVINPVPLNLGLNSSDTQMSAVQDPGNPNRYYLIHGPNPQGGPFVFTALYSIIDISGTQASISAANCNLEFTMPNGVDRFSEGVTVIPHCNGKDHWIMFKEKINSPGYFQGKFYTYLLTENGLSGVAPNFYQSNFNFPGSAVTLNQSPDGKKVAVRKGENESVVLFDFDNSIGNIIGEQQITSAPVGNLIRSSFCFSSSSEELYYKYGPLTGSQNIEAININTLNITPIGILPTGGSGDMQLGPDNNIYIANSNSFVSRRYLSVITSPNTPSTSALLIDEVLLDVDPSLYMAHYGTINLPNINYKLPSTPVEIHVSYTDCGQVEMSTNECYSEQVYDFSWTTSDGGGPYLTGAATHQFPASGTYTIDLELSFQGQVYGNYSETITVNLNAPTENIMGNSTPCEGSVTSFQLASGYGYDWTITQPDGAIDQSVLNPIDIAWSFGSGAGSVQVTYQDLTTGCFGVAALPINVSPNPNPSLGVSVTQNDCGACEGEAELDVNVIGGNAPYQIIWSDPLNQNTAIATSLCGGNYVVNVQDVNGCIGAATVDVLQSPTMSSIISTSNASCNGVCDGEATTSVFGGTPPFTFAWTTGGTVSTETGLCVGASTITVTDDLGCTLSSSVTITEPDILELTIASLNLACNDVNGGAPSAVVNGGTGPYSYEWLDVNGNTLPSTISTISGLTAGDYTCTVTDANGCQETTSFTLTSIDPVIDLITITHEGCIGSNSGALIAVGTSTVPPNSYTWYDASGNVLSTSYGINYITGGDYTFEVADFYGCTTSETFTINSDPCCYGDLYSIDAPTNTSTISIFNQNSGSGNYAINADLTVNSFFSITNGALVKMGPNVTITVQNGGVLSITGAATTVEACSDMWNGIVVEPGGQVIIDGAGILDAKAALTSTNGGHFEITNANFTNNYKGLVVNQFAGIHTGFIYGSTFDFSNVLRAPRSNHLPFVAIEINNVDQIDIGDIAQSQNQIFGHDHGIRGFNTNITIENNYFEDLKGTLMQACIPLGQCIPSPGRAIWLERNNGTHYSCTIRNNNFLNCRYMINTRNYKLSWINDNTGLNNQSVDSFNGSFITNDGLYGLSGISVTFGTNYDFALQTDGATVKILNNSLTDFNQHINLRNSAPLSNYNAYLILDIRYNTINNSLVHFPVGIRVDRYSEDAQEGLKYIRDNVLNDVGLGITSRLFTRTGIRIANNNVNLKNLPNTTGIRVRGGLIYRLTDNIIQGPGTSDYSIKGIDVSLDRLNIATCNGIYDVGQSMVYNGACQDATIQDNKLQNAQDGFVLRNGGIVGQQGSAGNPMDIWWDGTFSNSMAFTDNSDGGQSPFYVRNSTPYIPSPNIGFPPITINVTTGGAINGCLPILPIIAPPGGGGTVVKIAKDQVTYSDFETVNRYVSEKYAYDSIAEDTLVMLQDPDVQQFYAQKEVSNMGELKRVNKKINERQLLQADNMNNAIIPEHIAVENRKKVNASYIHRMNNSVSTADITELENIANQCPLEGGIAVYKARVLLDDIFKTAKLYHDVCGKENSKRGQINSIQDDVNNSLKLFRVYPNPASTMLTVEFEGEITNSVSVELYDISGKLIQKSPKNNRSNKIILSVNAVEKGVYFVKLIVDEEIKGVEKVTIIK